MTLNKNSPRRCATLCTKLCFLLFVFSAAGLSSGHNSISQTRDWQPQRTWVFVVGTLQWQHREMFDSFPRKNRRDAQLVENFRRQGVPGEQMVYLQDAQATTRQVKTAFTTFLTKAREGDFLFLYYCGHGYKSDDGNTTYFATYDAGDHTWAGQPTR